MTTGRPERNSAKATLNGDMSRPARTERQRNTRTLDHRRSPAPPAACRTIVFAKTGVFTVSLSKYHDTMATDPKEPQRQVTRGAARGDNPDTWAEVPRMLRESEFLLPPPWQDIFGPLRRGLVDEHGGGRAMRPVDRRPDRHRQRTFALHQRRRRACTSASPARAGRRGRGRRRHRAGRRSATDRAPRRRPQSGARGDRSERPAGADGARCWRTTAHAGW